MSTRGTITSAAAELVQLEDVDEEAALVRIDRRLFVVLLDQLLELFAQALLAVAHAAQMAEPVEEALERTFAVARAAGDLRPRQPSAPSRSR